jgi:hypothetical protein
MAAVGERITSRTRREPNPDARGPPREKEPPMRLAPAALLSAAALLGFATRGPAADDPKEVIAKAIKAHGGEETLAKLQAGQSRNKGKINLPGVGEVEFTQDVSYMLPDKLKDSLELQIAGQKVSVLTLVSGDKITIEANGQNIDPPEAAKTAIKEAGQMVKVARLYPIVREKGYELSLIGEAKVEGKETVGVRVSKKDAKEFNLFFYKDTGLLAKLEHRTADQNGTEVGEERIVLEYKKGDDGIPMPKKVLIKHDGKNFLEAEVLEAKLLEKLDDSEFKK